MNLIDLLISDKEKISLADVFMEPDNRARIAQVVKEYSYADELQRYQLPVNNKILLHGHTGCGKTMTAKAIAHSLGKELLILNLSNLVCSRIGETAQNIRQVFDKANRDKAVLFLDEFDQIGKARDHEDKDVGEMRRLVNTLIQLIDYLPLKTLLVCATNHPEIIDIALMRRFQVKIKFELPNPEVLDSYYDKVLSGFPQDLQKGIKRNYNQSFAETKDQIFTFVKARLIQKLDESKLQVQ